MHVTLSGGTTFCCGLRPFTEIQENNMSLSKISNPSIFSPTHYFCTIGGRFFCNFFFIGFTPFTEKQENNMSSIFFATKFRILRFFFSKTSFFYGRFFCNFFFSDLRRLPKNKKTTCLGYFCEKFSNPSSFFSPRLVTFRGFFF